MNKIIMMLMTFLCLFLSIQASTLQAPSNDPFYTPPAKFENKKPGTILKFRILPTSSLPSISNENLKAIYQFLYRTNDGLGKPTASVTTLLVPTNADPTKLISYQASEDSASKDCAPSYIYQQELNPGPIPIPSPEPFLLDDLLSRGYYLNMADYEGLQAMFAVGLMAGHAVLDSIRAVLNSGNLTQLHPDATVQMLGYSAGAHATGWAAQLQSSYASELKIIGAAMGGTPVDVNATINAVNGGPFASLIPSGILGMMHQYDDLADYVDQIILPDKKQEFLEAQSMCSQDILDKYAFQDIFSYFSRPDFLADPVAIKAISNNIMGKMGAPRFPLFMFHAIHDEIVPIAPAMDLYNSWCADTSTSIQFVADELSEHFILTVTGTANAINFLVDQFNNKTAPPGCTYRTTVTSALDDDALPFTVRLILYELETLLGYLPVSNNTFLNNRKR
ncbi:secretory lipase-domain-containing protein [Halteromyces radiatus]|uniref:secretory lipase-domain-containing protein n=1 Tax=Halteromyces radiatus TaxID=101107 RepID=UPI00221F2E3E|nr:secretory lipase-domain-containing protein [Halteromyces radiatus]KAI8086683.1 secretory lipase-domain-containing protein [Halteromyces radiatus]